MMDWLRKNNKKVLAVVGVFLMISFISIDRGGSMRGRSGDQIDHGKIDGKPVTDDEFRRAAYELDIVGKGIRSHRGMMDYTLLEATLIHRLFSQAQGANVIQLARVFAKQIDPMTYLLLVREAKEMGITVTLDSARSFMVGYSLEADAELEKNPAPLNSAIVNWMSAMEAFDRIAAAGRMSDAEAVYEVARRQQQVGVDLVEFKAESFKSKVAEPTDAQLDAFFKKYQDTPPDTGEFGFGYRFPNRARIHLIKVSAAEVKKTVSLEDVVRYHRANTARFQTDPSTQPASRPATRVAGPEKPLTTKEIEEARKAAEAALAATRPTTRPVEEVKEQIIQTLAEQRAAAIAQLIQTTMAPHWQDFLLSVRGSKTTLPVKPLPTNLEGHPFHEYDYFRALAEQVQRMPQANKVLPITINASSLMSAKEMAASFIGADGAFNESGLRLPEVATTLVDVFHSADEAKKLRQDRPDLPLLSLYQPSPIFRDAQGNYYIFRVVEADKSHEAKSLADVRAKVREDYITNEAYKLAKEQAQKLVESAKRIGLKPAASAAGPDLKVINVEPFMEGIPTPSYKLPDSSAAKFSVDAFKLLHERLRTGEEKPRMLIELPRAAIVDVAELDQAISAVESPLFGMEVARTRKRLDLNRAGMLLIRWLQHGEVAKRMKFVAGAGHRNVEPEEAPEPPSRGPIPGL